MYYYTLHNLLRPGGVSWYPGVTCCWCNCTWSMAQVCYLGLCTSHSVYICLVYCIPKGIFFSSRSDKIGNCGWSNEEVDGSQGPGDSFKLWWVLSFPVMLKCSFASSLYCHLSPFFFCNVCRDCLLSNSDSWSVFPAREAVTSCLLSQHIGVLLKSHDCFYSFLVSHIIKSSLFGSVN